MADTFKILLGEISKRLRQKAVTEANKMIDKKTVPNYFSLWVNKNLEKDFEKQHIEEVGEKEHKENPQLVITHNSMGTLTTDEYYFDEESCSITYSGTSENNYFYFNSPVYFFIDFARFVSSFAFL